MGRALELAQKPRRIISLVPSQSEYLWELGVKKELVGITKFCVHPEEMFRSVKWIGGTKTPDLEKIRALKPDLIIGNKEENDAQSIAALEKEFPVWMSDVIRIEQALQMMQELADISGRVEEGKTLLEEVKKSLALSRGIFRGERVAYFIWQEPWLLAGRNTFINSILEHCGLQNIAEPDTRYPEYSEKQLKEAKADWLFLSSEPYPFGEKQAEYFRRSFPETRVCLVDGETFSWYGSRLLQLNAYLEKLKTELYA